MPCSDYPSDADLARDAINRLNKNLEPLLCEACGILKDAKLTSNMSAALRKWWKKHEREDRERRKQEQEQETLKKLADKAISKLSSEEIEALREHHGLRFSGKKRTRR